MTDNTLFEKLNSDIWEFRTLYNKKQYRLFAFWDKTDNKVTIVIATHGIVKKTQKTPKKEIDKATELMNKYFDSKNKKR
ncbi:type II toxin-antitoxin system RelE/ParE family toxin [Nonlabens dokdonensis]|uniref:type II toxin-antitoxin system RelE/ParE family toxin n=1 Tax=Nonlabens dokdonensis TaxID=328515 RepID=UPI003898F15C